MTRTSPRSRPPSWPATSTSRSHSTLRPTHEGDFQGVAPTGRRIEVRGLQIGRFRDGRIVERWGSTDELAIMPQLNAAPQPS